jgi:SAM-dependent methyltransferase
MNERVKQRLSRLARDSHALNSIDQVLYLLDRAKSYRGNRRFMRVHPGFIVPPGPLAFDAFGHTDSAAYLQTGVDHARFIAEIARERVPGSQIRVLEWGCGPGRIIRHLPGLLSDKKATIVGVDLSPATIAWCRRSIPGITFERNDLDPPLPFSDGSFDFIYAISVFTHLDLAAWEAWLRELSRVMSDGSVLLFTTQGRQYMPKLLPDESALFNSGRPVFRAKIAQGKKRFAAYHPREFVLHGLPRELRVVWHSDTPDVPGLRQDVWIVTKADPVLPESHAVEAGYLPRK